MKEVVLSNDASVEAANVRAELTRIRALKGRVYRTTVHAPYQQNPASPMPEHLITTSKEIHLRLGLMSIEAQWEFAMLIRNHLMDHTSGALLLSESEDKHGAILVTIVLSQDDKDLHIHLSQAN